MSTLATSVASFKFCSSAHCVSPSLGRSCCKLETLRAAVFAVPEPTNSIELMGRDVETIPTLDAVEAAVGGVLRGLLPAGRVVVSQRMPAVLRME